VRTASAGVLPAVDWFGDLVVLWWLVAVPIVAAPLLLAVVAWLVVLRRTSQRQEPTAWKALRIAGLSAIGCGVLLAVVLVVAANDRLSETEQALQRRLSETEQGVQRRLAFVEGRERLLDNAAESCAGLS
jgi:hypothetical protein